MQDTSILTISHVSKTYAGGTHALDDVSLTLRRGEVFALLGPNGAGKTTLIGTICGVVRLERGHITVCGHDIVRDWRAARRCIGLVPQEVNVDIFLTVRQAVTYQRGYYGRRRDDALVERTLRRLTLWDKRDTEIRALSGGMKRRVMIAKALMNEPQVLFLDEPTAGVDVELRRDFWDLVRELKRDGTTIVLTTHYIEEAEALADRIGIIAAGRIATVDTTANLLTQLGSKTVTITLDAPLSPLPRALAQINTLRHESPATLVYTADATHANELDAILAALHDAGAHIADITTTQTSLEDIFVNLVKQHTR